MCISLSRKITQAINFSRLFIAVWKFGYKNKHPFTEIRKVHHTYNWHEIVLGNKIIPRKRYFKEI